MVLNKVKTLKEILLSQTIANEDALGSICLQLILVDIIKELELCPTGIFCDTSCTIVSAYYYNDIELEEAVLAATELSKVNFGSNMSFQTSRKLVDLKSRQSVKEDYLTYEIAVKPSKGTIILNLSDLALCGENNLLVQDGTGNLLGLFGR